jgi:hypothetical protein
LPTAGNVGRPEAMSVDAFTYLFNLWAERIKKDPQLEMAYLWSYRTTPGIASTLLELIPPAISVATLIMVTVFTLRDSLKPCKTRERRRSMQDVDISIMLFSGLNLLLDVVNVTCFATRRLCLWFERDTAERRWFREHPQESKGIINQVIVSWRRLRTRARICRLGRLRGGTEDDDDYVVYLGRQRSTRNPVNLNMCSVDGKFKVPTGVLKAMYCILLDLD